MFSRTFKNTIQMYRMLYSKKYIFLILILFMCFASSLRISTQRPRNYLHNISVHKDNVCTTLGCKNAAELIHSNINENVNPCKNFYNFACGGFITKVTIPENKQLISRVSDLEKNVLNNLKTLLEEEVSVEEPRIIGLVKNYYKACTNLAAIENIGLQPLFEILNRLGGWPVSLGAAWSDANFDWIATSIKLQKLGYPQKYILKVFVDNDVYNTSRNMIFISEGEPEISVRSLKKGLNHADVQIYYRFMIDIAVLLGADREQAAIELKEVVEFEVILTLFASESYDYTGDTLNINTIKDLEIQLPYMSWLEYLNNIAYPVVELDETYDVVVEKPFYLYNLQWVLEQTSKRTIANYLMWRAIVDSIPHLNDEIFQIYRKFRQEYLGKEIPLQPRWEQCIKQLTDKNNGITVGISSLYIRRYFDDYTRNDVKNIVHSIADEFQYLLKKIPWMDNGTKQKAIRKSYFMREIVGYPDELLNNTLIDDYSKNLDISRDNHFQNFLNVHRFLYDYSLSGLTDSLENTIWTTFSDSTIINAYYHSMSNTFVLLAAILQPPIFNPYWPSYAKYGSVGFIIAHEMMHAFDSERFMYDETGSFKQWFTDESANEYYKRIACYIKQYQQYTDKRVGLNINGTLTLNENLADNVGLRVSYTAYKNWIKKNGVEPRLPDLNYTQEQIFWITSVNFLCSKETTEHRLILLLTEEHTPDIFRAVGELSNSKEFANAFKCPTDSPMNPENKCKLT